MALGIPEQSGGGSGHPYVKYDAKAGRWFRRKRDDEQSDVDITNKLNMMVDLAHIQVGWVMFSTTTGPSFEMVTIGQPFPSRPEGKDWKMGFRMLVALGKECGGGVHEVASSARAFINKIDALHDRYKAARESSEGLLPIVKMDGVEVIESQSPKGMIRNYAPRLIIDNWAKPPADLQPIVPKNNGKRNETEFPGDRPTNSVNSTTGVYDPNTAEPDYPPGENSR